MNEKLIEEMARAMLETLPVYDPCLHVGIIAFARACAPIAYRAGLEAAAGIAETCRARDGTAGSYGLISLMRCDIAAAIRKAREA